MPRVGWLARPVHRVSLTMTFAFALVFALQAAALQPGPTQAAAAGQLSQAEARYRAAIETTPGMAAYHESLALVLEREGRMEEAVASHREAVRLDSMSARNRAGLGQALLRVGRDVDAISELQAASRLDRRSVEIRKQLAAALLKQSRNDQALAVLREARQLDSTDRDVDRAIALIGRGETRTEPAPPSTGSHLGPVVRRVLETIFALVLGICALALLGPLVAGLLLAFVQLPRQWPRRAAA
jgi:Flp pilus assembly protein TadD